VTAGQPLLEIDSRDVRASINEASARAATARQSIAAVQTSLRVAQNQYALYTGVEDARAVSRQEVIIWRDAVADARAQLGVAQAQARRSRCTFASISTKTRSKSLPSVSRPSSARVAMRSVRSRRRLCASSH